MTRKATVWLVSLWKLTTCDIADADVEDVFRLFTLAIPNPRNLHCIVQKDENKSLKLALHSKSYLGKSMQALSVSSIKSKNTCAVKCSLSVFFFFNTRNISPTLEICGFLWTGGVWRSVIWTGTSCQTSVVSLQEMCLHFQNNVVEI